jgi:hypothetical protein
VHDVFLAVVRSREKLDGVRDLTAYLFAALHRAAGGPTSRVRPQSGIASA